MKQHRFVAVTQREDYVRWLRQDLGQDAELAVVDQPGVERALQLVEAVRADIVFVQVDPDSRDGIAIIEGLVVAKPQLTCIAISDSDDNGLLLAAMRAGARDFLRARSSPRELLALLDRVHGRQSLESSPESRGKAIALLSARPYEGVTTLAVHLAIALQERVQTEQGKVLLLDLGVPTADCLLFLGLESDYDFVDAVRGVRRFDRSLIETALTRHESGLTILSLPEDHGELRGVTSADVLILLNALKAYFTHIVIHLGGASASDFVRLVLANCERTLLIAEQSVPSCYASKRLLDFLNDHDHPETEIRLLIDRYSANVGLDERDIAKLLDVEPQGRLPPSGMVRLKALNSGRSIFEVAPHDPYSKAVRALAAQLVNGDAPQPQRSPLLRRLFGR